MLSQLLYITMLAQFVNLLFMSSPTSRRSHSLFGISVRASLNTWSYTKNCTCPYKLLVGISPNSQLRSSCGQRWSDYILKSKGLWVARQMSPLRPNLPQTSVAEHSVPKRFEHIKKWKKQTRSQTSETRGVHGAKTCWKVWATIFVGCRLTGFVFTEICTALSLPGCCSGTHRVQGPQ